MVLQQQLQVLKYVESYAMSGMVIDNIIVCLYKALELAESEMEKNAVRESVSALLQSILFMSEAKQQYDIKKNKEEAIEMISNAGNLISDSVTAVANANKKAETFDFNELNHIKLTLDSRRDAIVEKQNLIKNEIEEKEQQLENAGLFQRQLKFELSSAIDNLRMQSVEIENELIAINEKVQIVDNVISPINSRIEEYAANLSRIAERYAVCKF